MSACERTGWRDEGLSQRHRRWGFNCPAVDVDFLMIEYNNATPTAIIEYKNEHANPCWQEASYKALSSMGTMADIPALVVMYADDFSWWKIGALNEIGVLFLGNKKGKKLTEIEYVELLYELRGLNVPNHVRRDLQNDVP